MRSTPTNARSRRAWRLLALALALGVLAAQGLAPAHALDHDAGVHECAVCRVASSGEAAVAPAPCCAAFVIGSPEAVGLVDSRVPAQAPRRGPLSRAPPQPA